MKLNCDMGESFGSWKMGMDAEVMPHIDMTNIACGFHASDPQIMSHTVDLAIKHGVTIGAHPGYPDLLGFGRKEIKFSFDELVNMTLYQIGALQAICSSKNTSVSYVKPHGALYNMMMRDTDVYKALITAMSGLSHKIPLMIMATPEHETYVKIAQDKGVEVLFEAFCDRAYTDEGLLQPRTIEGAVHKDLDSIVKQAVQLITDHSVTSCTGKKLNIKADSICIHGDGPLALDSVKRIKEALSS